MEESYCIACQYGDHASHIDYPEIPSPGVMGGWHCPCKGERARPSPDALPAKQAQPDRLGGQPPSEPEQP